MLEAVALGLSAEAVAVDLSAEAVAVIEGAVDEHSRLLASL